MYIVIPNQFLYMAGHFNLVLLLWFSMLIVLMSVSVPFCTFVLKSSSRPCYLIDHLLGKSCSHD